MTARTWVTLVGRPDYPVDSTIPAAVPLYGDENPDTVTVIAIVEWTANRRTRDQQPICVDLVYRRTGAGHYEYDEAAHG